MATPLVLLLLQLLLLLLLLMLLLMIRPSFCFPDYDELLSNLLRP